MNKVLGIGARVFGVILALALLFGVVCGFGLLLMLSWNFIAVGMTTIAVAVTFWKAVEIVAIIWAILVLISVLKFMVLSHIQKWQMDTAIRSMRKFAEQMEKAGGKQEPPDLMKHFGHFGGV